MKCVRRWIGRRITVVAVAMAVAVFSGPAFGQIIGAAGRGKIEWHSGFFPWNAPPGAVRLPPLPFLSAPLPLVLPNVFHLSPFGYAEGSGGLGVAANAAQYAVIVPGPPATHLLQIQSRPSLPATLDFQYDTAFRLGAGGFPAHITRLAYPIVGNNGPGLGSFVRVTGFVQVWGFDNLNRVVWVRILQDNFFTIRLGPFVRLLFAQSPVPATPPGGRIASRGFLRFEAAGRPVFGAAAAPMANGNDRVIDLNGANVNGVSKDLNGVDACTSISLNGAADGLPIMGLDACGAPIGDDVVHEDYPDDFLAVVNGVADPPPLSDLMYPEPDACSE